MSKCKGHSVSLHVSFQPSINMISKGQSHLFSLSGAVAGELRIATLTRSMEFSGNMVGKQQTNLDDLYKQRAERKVSSNSKHPLLLQYELLSSGRRLQHPETRLFLPK